MFSYDCEPWIATKKLKIKITTQSERSPEYNKIWQNQKWKNKRRITKRTCSKVYRKKTAEFVGTHKQDEGKQTGDAMIQKGEKRKIKRNVIKDLWGILMTKIISQILELLLGTLIYSKVCFFLRKRLLLNKTDTFHITSRLYSISNSCERDREVMERNFRAFQWDAFCRLPNTMEL